MAFDKWYTERASKYFSFLKKNHFKHTQSLGFAKLPIECGDCEQMTVTSLHLSLLTHRFNGFDDDDTYFSRLYRLNELVSIHLEN